MSKLEKIKIDIWSDIVCPFCYIGKRKLEQALEQFPQRELVEIEWHSFQLDPELKVEKKVDIFTYLAERKGISKSQSEAMHSQVVQMAKENGLDYRFDKTVVANSFDAHRLIQYAKKYQLSDQAEELIFNSYFTQGKDIGDLETLVSIGKDLGLSESELRQVMTGQVYSEDVKKDIELSRQLGIRGVPFFVFQMKYGISGAQPTNVFLKALQQAVDEQTETKV